MTKKTPSSKTNTLFFTFLIILLFTLLLLISKSLHVSLWSGECFNEYAGNDHYSLFVVSQQARNLKVLGKTLMFGILTINENYKRCFSKLYFRSFSIFQLVLVIFRCYIFNRNLTMRCVFIHFFRNCKLSDYLLCNMFLTEMLRSQNVQKLSKMNKMNLKRNLKKIKLLHFENATSHIVHLV